MSQWIAALPMYNVTPRHAVLWRALLRDALDAFANAGGPAGVALLDEPFDDLHALWRRDDLLLSQTCGYPYRMLGLRDTVHLIATPAFDAEGCNGARYRSVLVVSARVHAGGATTLAACRGLRAAFNGGDSHSGMNALRHAVAPHAHDGRFFGSVTPFGSHLNALRALASGEADCAAIDCVTFAYVRDALPDLLKEIRIIGTTASVPGAVHRIAGAGGNAGRRIAGRARLRGRGRRGTLAHAETEGIRTAVAGRLRNDCAVCAGGRRARVSGTGVRRG